MRILPSFAKAYVRFGFPATRTVPHSREARPIVSSEYLRYVRIGIFDLSLFEADVSYLLEFFKCG